MLRVFLRLFLCFLVLATTTITFAQELPPEMPVPTAEEWRAFIEAIGGIKSLSAMGLVALAVQGLLLGLRLLYIEIPGKHKLLLVHGLTLFLSMLTLYSQGMDLISVLLHSTTLSAFQVFAHQIYKQFFEKKTEANARYELPR